VARILDIMELDEAIKILPTITEYFSLSSVEKEIIELDGVFTIKQLEALITIFRNRDKIQLLE
jgi:hypothetical protein